MKKNSRKSNCHTNAKTGINKPYRQNRKSKSTETFTTDEIVAWAEHHADIPPRETEKELDISERTYYRYVKNIDQAVKQSINLDDLRNIMLMLFSLALKSVIHNLKECHPHMTVAYLKGMGIFKEHIKGEDMGKTEQNFYLGDKLVNEIADKVLLARSKEVKGLGDRFKEARLSDLGDSISGN